MGGGRHPRIRGASGARTRHPQRLSGALPLPKPAPVRERAHPASSAARPGLEDARVGVDRAAPTSPSAPGWSGDRRPWVLVLAIAGPAGVPVVALVVVAGAALAALLLQRSVFGRAVAAGGQEPQGAWLVGIHGGRTVAIAYL